MPRVCAFLLASLALWGAVPRSGHGATSGGDRREFRAEVARLRQIQARHEEALLRLPGVMGLGIGASADRSRPMFVVLVEAAAPLPAVPAQIEDVEVRVERRDPIRLQDGTPGCAKPCHADQMPPPVQMGNSGGWVQGPSCSLGFKACDLGTGQMVYVTASHCNDTGSCSQNSLGADHQHPGTNDEQGAPLFIGDVSGHAAPVCRSGANNYTDATKVASPGMLTSIAFRDAGLPEAVPADVLPGDGVQKSGRTTGLTTGEVTLINLTIDVPALGGFCCGALTMNDQIESTVPGEGGDSGSALLTLEEPPRVAGLHFGGANGFSYANHVDRVLSALNLSLNLVSCVQDCLFGTAASSTGRTGSGLVELGHRFRNQVLRRTEAGRGLVQIYHQFSDEAVAIARARPMLLARTAALLLHFEPALRELVELGRTRVGTDGFKKVDELLQDYAAAASPGMREALDEARRAIKDPEVQRGLGVVAEPGT